MITIVIISYVCIVYFGLQGMFDDYDFPCHIIKILIIYPVYYDVTFPKID